jgi:pimeloyl-ACP methyl ester carboxylesterase
MVRNWVLLRGLARESRHWGAFPRILAGALPGDRLAMPDLPGNGLLHEVTTPTRVEAIAEHCRRGLRDQGMAPPYHLLALSLGGMVAVAWALRHPGELGAAVLVNTSLAPFSPFHHRLRPGAYAPLLAAALCASASRREARILALTSNRSPSTAILQAWTRYATERPTRRANLLRQLLAARRFSAPAAAPPVPMLVLASRGDRLVDPRCSERIAAAWHLPLVMHPDAGHDLPLDDPAWVAARIVEWLSAQAAAPDAG